MLAKKLIEALSVNSNSARDFTSVWDLLFLKIDLHFSFSALCLNYNHFSEKKEIGGWHFNQYFLVVVG